MTAQQEEITRLAVEIADSTAMSDIECFCHEEQWSGPHIGTWYDTATADDQLAREYVDRAVRYLDLKGELEHHPENTKLVRKRTFDFEQTA